MNRTPKNKTIGVIAVKGGVGKTTTVANLAATMAHDFNQRVLVVDANYSAPNLGLHLGIIDPVHSLHDVLQDKVPTKEAIIKHKYGFDVLPSSLTPKKINPYKLKNRLETIKDSYDVILLDSSPALNEEMLSAIVASDEVVVITSPDFPSLSCAIQSIKASKNKNISGIIINKSYGKKFELTAKEIEATSGIPVIGVLGHDVKIMESLSKQIPFTKHKPHAKVAVGYKELAGRLLGMSPKRRGFFERFFKKEDESFDEPAEIPKGLEDLI